MSIRKMIRKTNVETQTLSGIQSFVLEYYLLERETALEGESQNTYGIEVLKRSHPTNSTLRIEYRKIFDIFCRRAEAMAVLNILAENTVTPVSIRDILEQFIGNPDITSEEYEIIAV